MKNKFIPLVIAIPLLWLGNDVRAQKLAELRQQFVGEKAVMLNKSLEYTIALKDGEPDVTSHETTQIEFLTPDATSFMNGYSFSHSDFHKVVSYEAYTTTPEGKKLKVTEFKTVTDKESFVFYDDVKETRFNVPSVEPGAVGSLLVTRQNTDPHLLGPCYFTSYIPIVNSELKLIVSKDIAIKYVLAGQDTSAISVNVESKRHNNIYTFTAKNQHADKRYADAPGFAWYSPHVIFHIQGYRGSDGKNVTYLSNCDDLYHLSYGYLKSVNKQIGSALSRVVDSLTHNLSTNESKARSIYSWVQHNIKYVAFEDGMGGFIPRDASLVYDRRFGDCKDMASILTAMMTRAGINAYFTWLGTRDLPYDFNRVPLPITSNHMICTVNLDGRYVFLDATDPACVFGMPSAGIQDKDAMISISDRDYKILRVPTVEGSKNTLIDTTRLELTPAGLRGQITRTFKGYFASEMHDKLLYWERKDLDEYMKDELTRGSNKFHLDTFKIGDQANPAEMSLSATFTLPDYAKKIGNEYYLNLNLLKEYQDKQFDYPSRKVPVFYEYKSIRKYVTLFKIPNGYKLTFVPQNKSYRDNSAGFKIRYEQKDGWIVLTQEFDNDRLMLANNEFESWQKLLTNLFPTYKETLSIARN